MLYKQENGLELVPVYSCGKTKCLPPRYCDLAMKDSCCHTLDPLYAEDKETVELFNKLTEKFNLTIYRLPAKGGGETIQIIFEEK